MSQLLKEYIDRNAVSEAINNLDVVTIYYSGDKTINRGYRTIEPYALGTTSSGNLAVRAWQQGGATDTGNRAHRDKLKEVPGWRLFRLDGITTFNKSFRKFSNKEEWLKTNRPKYNPNDRQLHSIIAAVQPISSGVVKTMKPKDDRGFFNKQAQKFKSFFNKNLGTDFFKTQKQKFDRTMRSD